MVNENSSILSLLLILYSILSANVSISVYLDLFYAGSTHLHGIRCNDPFVTTTSEAKVHFFFRFWGKKATKITI